MPRFISVVLFVASFVLFLLLAFGVLSLARADLWAWACFTGAFAVQAVFGAGPWTWTKAA